MNPIHSGTLAKGQIDTSRTLMFPRQTERRARQVNYCVNLLNYAGTYYPLSEVFLMHQTSLSRPNYYPNQGQGYPLSSPISFGRGAQPIATAAPGSELPAGTLATITGWGALKSGSSSRNQLYAGLVKIVSISDCRRAYPTHAITDNMFCAVGEGVGGCQVDSGGALLVNGVAYGIYSWGYGCDHPDYHGVYTKLSKYHSFISQFIWKGIIS
ncbi:Trypsin-2 [Folsomia candida]|uniref:Trypsin-2 n=1 Tax=Folsomia candida TaxID=158441 RepID=A0A226DMN3_FOLCA|nr:Trypsin-2 [Folsomia candida]